VPRQGVAKMKAAAIHGVIDTSWTLKKTAILVMEADHLQDELLRQEGVSTAKKQQKAGTVDENAARTLNSHRQLLKVNETLCILKDASNTTTNKKSKISQADAARSAMGKLRQAQESLRKALENKRKSLGSVKSYQQVTPEVAKSTREPTSEDLKGMLESVLKRTRSREEAQTPDIDNSADDSDSPPTSSSKEVQVQDSDDTDES